MNQWWVTSRVTGPFLAAVILVFKWHILLPNASFYVKRLTDNSKSLFEKPLWQSWKGFEKQVFFEKQML